MVFLIQIELGIISAVLGGWLSLSHTVNGGEGVLFRCFILEITFIVVKAEHATRIPPVYTAQVLQMGPLSFLSGSKDKPSLETHNQPTNQTTSAVQLYCPK